MGEIWVGLAYHKTHSRLITAITASDQQIQEAESMINSIEEVKEDDKKAKMNSAQ